MATLKEHQAAMVDLLASGSGIPASASRLAHAMHDVLEMLNLQPGDAAWRVTTYNQMQELFSQTDATTPGLNDKALSKREKALKTDSPAKWPTPAEQRVKELENTIKQLKVVNAVFKAQRNDYAKRLADLDALEGTGLMPEQAGCRREDTQVCNHTEWAQWDGTKCCSNCGVDL